MLHHLLSSLSHIYGHRPPSFQEKASESKALKASKHRRRSPVSDGFFSAPTRTKIVCPCLSLQNEGSGSEGSDGSDSDSDNDNEKSPGGGGRGNSDATGGQSTVEEEDEEAEWEKFQKKMNK